MTGTEAISNGVSIFRVPQARNARTTLVLMSTHPRGDVPGRLGPGRGHPQPCRSRSGTPTVVSEIGQARLRHDTGGHMLFYALQAATAFILILAGQHQLHRVPLPGQLRRRGLVPAPQADGPRAIGWSSPTASSCWPAPSIALLLGHRGQGVRAHPHVRHRGLHRLHHGRGGHGEAPPEPTGRGTGARACVNGFAAVVCAVVVVVFAVAEFTQGAWVVVVVMPLIVYALVRTNQAVPGRGHRARGGRGGRGVRGQDPPPPRRGDPDRPDRPGRGPGHPVRPAP